MKDALQTFINDELLSAADGVTVSPDDDLLMSGLIDSIGVMRLVAFVEETFAVTVPPEDVTLESFSTITSIATYVSGLRG